MWNHVPEHVIPDVANRLLVYTAPNACETLGPPLKPAAGHALSRQVKIFMIVMVKHVFCSYLVQYNTVQGV